MYHTGTHLLAKALQGTFQSSIFTWGSDEVGPVNCRFWKHSSLSILEQEAPHELDDCARDNFIGLAMIRNPLDWVTSVRGWSYDLIGVGEKQGPFALDKTPSWPIDPIRFNLNHDSASAFIGNTEFPNIGSIWNRWNKDYQNLASFNLTKGMVIRYEDLVQDPEQVMSQVAEFAGLKMSYNKTNISDCTWCSGKKSVEDSQSRSYLRSFTPLELSQYCKTLDIDLMRKYGYTECDMAVQLRGTALIATLVIVFHLVWL
jgi:hypothetical protein